MRLAHLDQHLYEVAGFLLLCAVMCTHDGQITSQLHLEPHQCLEELLSRLVELVVFLFVFLLQLRMQQQIVLV